MSLSATETAKIVKEHQLAEGDTGSPEVQIALLSARIITLTVHLKTYLHDYHSQRGLLRMVSHRRKLLEYLRRKDIERHRKIIKQLGLRAKRS